MKSVVLLSFLTIAIFGQVNANNQADQNYRDKIQKEINDIIENRFGFRIPPKAGIELDEQDHDLALDGTSGFLLQKQGSAKVAARERYETYTLQNNFYLGVNYLNAIYAGGAIIVTTLDGPFKGYQHCFINGELYAETKNVQWNKDNFTHQYPDGRIITFANKQVVEIY